MVYYRPMSRLNSPRSSEARIGAAGFIENKFHPGFSRKDVLYKSALFLHKNDRTIQHVIQKRDRLAYEDRQPGYLTDSRRSSAEIIQKARDIFDSTKTVIQTVRKDARKGASEEKIARKINSELLIRMPEILAAASAVAVETVGLNPYETQIQAAVAAIKGNGERGNLIEMQTGEGKTLVTALTASTIALEGKGVHIGETNDYLAERNIRELGPMYAALGLSVSLIKSDGTQWIYDPENPNGLTPLFQNKLIAGNNRYKAYEADITYGPVSELAFDYLKDNREYDGKRKRQVKGLHCLILDEADQSLIGDATTAYILEGEPKDDVIPELNRKPTKLYKAFARIGALLDEYDYSLDKQNHTVQLFDASPLQTEPKISVDMPNYILSGLSGIYSGPVLKIEEPAIPIRPKKEYTIDSLTNYLREKGVLGESRNLSQDRFKMYVKALSLQGMDKVNALMQLDGLLNPRTVLFANSQEGQSQDPHVTGNAKFLLGILENTLNAWTLFERDADYFIDQQANEQTGNVTGEIKIIDVQRFTGRVLGTRRYSDGLHQAIEAKERLLNRDIQIDVKPESNSTLGMIATKAFAGKYTKLVGMSATLIRKAKQLHTDYGVDVIAIKRHKESQRYDSKDEAIFLDRDAKFHAIFVSEILPNRYKRQPILIGLQTSEDVLAAYDYFKRAIALYNENVSDLQKIKLYLPGEGQVNEDDSEGLYLDFATAENNDLFADKMKVAGKRGRITISNMAGRGTDIKLSDEVRRIGGLRTIGEHGIDETDEQLKGRSRMGSTIFYTSAEDRFLLLGLGQSEVDKLKKNIARTHKDLPNDPSVMVGRKARKIIKKAQRNYEQREENSREQLEKDQVIIGKAREELYGSRKTIIEAPISKEDKNKALTLDENIQAIIEHAIGDMVAKHTSSNDFRRGRSIDQTALAIYDDFADMVLGPMPYDEPTKERYFEALNALGEYHAKQDDMFGIPGLPYEFNDRLVKLAKIIYGNMPHGEYTQELRRQIILRLIDSAWSDHLGLLEDIRRKLVLGNIDWNDSVLTQGKLTALPPETPFEIKFAINADIALESTKRDFRRDTAERIFREGMRGHQQISLAILGNLPTVLSDN